MIYIRLIENGKRYPIWVPFDKINIVQTLEASGIEAEILFAPAKGKKIGAESPPGRPKSTNNP